MTRDGVGLSTLHHYGIEIREADNPAAWTTRLRTGLATLVSEHDDDPMAGLDVLSLLCPGGRQAAGLSEQDLWARLLLRSGAVEEAIAATLDRQRVRDSWIPRIIRLEALLALPDIDSGQRAVSEIREIHGDDSVVAANAMGTIALAEGRVADAEALFQLALAKRPDNIPALRGRALALRTLGDVDEANSVMVDALHVANAEAKPRLIRDCMMLQLEPAGPDGSQGLGAELRASLEALAARLRDELDGTRVAASRSGRVRIPDAVGATPRSDPLSGLLELARQDGDDVPPDELRQTLFEHFGYAEFRPGQAAVLRSLLVDGKDTLAVMPTGAGKSLCFQLPALVLKGVVVVVSPLVALMADQLAGLADVTALAERATFINSSLPSDEVERRMRLLAEGAYSLVYLAPERLRLGAVQNALRLAGVSLLVIDEAHCLSLWGHDFRTEYLAVGSFARALQVPRVLAVTATATPIMQDEIAVTLGRRLQVVRTGVLRDNLFLEVRRLDNESQKKQCLTDFARGVRGSGIVYATSRDTCESLAAHLRRNGVQAAHYHAAMPSTDRRTAQDAFMAGRVRVLVATVAFGMGVNKRDVRFIVHYQPARSLEAYTQEVGRAGRDGAPAHCLLLYSSADRSTLTRHANEDHVEKPALRALYGAVRAAARRAGGGPIDPDALLPRSTENAGNDVASRVGLSLLERAGYLHRGLDCPREFTITWSRVAAGSAANPGRPAAGSYDGRPDTLDAVAAARALDCTVEDVQRRLFDQQSLGNLVFRPGRRGMVVRVAEPPPSDGAAALDRLIDAYALAAKRRAVVMADYAESRECRNAVISRHFGDELAGRCGRCDACRPDLTRTSAPAKAPKSAPRRSSMEPRAAVLGVLGDLPFKVGRSGMIKILRGSSSAAVGPDRSNYHGVLGATSEAIIGRVLEELVADGLVERIAVDDYFALALTARGRVTDGRAPA